jgi:hypothetical protein
MEFGCIRDRACAITQSRPGIDEKWTPRDGGSSRIIVVMP